MLSSLRPYQLAIANAVLDSVFYHKGLTFSVEIARQGGKNELSARLERLLLTLNLCHSVQLIKCSPTFKPQTVISMQRLKDRLNDAGFNGSWTSELGYIIRLGEARAVFLSAEASSNVVGNTAHLLLEVDESQDVSPDKYTKEFKPMTTTTNCTVVHYGTTWDDSTLLESIKQTNLELQKKDGIQRHFRYDYQEVGRYNPAYLANVEMERQRIGENHPLFLTQYRLLPLRGGGGFLSLQQLAQLVGTHSRLPGRQSGKVYIAALDLAGQAESETDLLRTDFSQKRDSTVLTIAELDFSLCDALQKQPRLLVVEQYSWLGEPHTRLYGRLVDLLQNVWHCSKVVVDSTGVGEPVAAFLQEALGRKIVPFKFTARSKSDLGFNLLAAVNAGRLKLYAQDNSTEYIETMRELSRSKSFYRPNQTLNFFVDPADGHDDFLMSLALLIEAAGLYHPRTAQGAVPSSRSSLSTPAFVGV